MASLKSSSTSSKLGFFSQSRKNPGLVSSNGELGQRLPISGAKLADGVVQKGPPLRRPDLISARSSGQNSTVWTIPSAPLRFSASHGSPEASADAPGQLGLNEKGPVPAVHLGCDGPLIPLKGDELPSPLGPGETGPRRKSQWPPADWSFLGILSQITLTPRVKRRQEKLV